MTERSPALPSTPMTVADALRPAGDVSRALYNLVLVVGGTLLVAASARVAIPLPFSPVPVTGQTFAVLLVGALYGSRLGALTLVAYLAEGAAGLPVFAAGGAGAAHLLGPTGGYLLGFVAAAGVTGLLAEHGWDRRFGATALAMTLGTAMIFTPGVFWLGAIVGPEAALLVGLWPFLPGAAAKIILAATLLPVGWRVLERLRADGAR